MKKQDLIKMIEALPDDAEILISSYDEIMGYCSYNDPYIEECVKAYQYTSKTGSIGFEATYSNWRPPNYKKVNVYLLS